MVGAHGHVTGIDMTPEMLTRARVAATEMGATNVEFAGSEAEQLPFLDASFDVVISNGVIDLIPQRTPTLLQRHGFERIEIGQLVDTYARSKFEYTRRRAQKFGARGTTLKAYKPIS